jgi:hypothetical protein
MNGKRELAKVRIATLVEDKSGSERIRLAKL